VFFYFVAYESRTLSHRDKHFVLYKDLFFSVFVDYMVVCLFSIAESYTIIIYSILA